MLNKSSTEDIKGHAELRCIQRDVLHALKNALPKLQSSEQKETLRVFTAFHFSLTGHGIVSREKQS